MKKVLSGIMALMLAGALTLPVFAAEGDITAESVTINAEEENLKDSLKNTADDEEGMLRISPSTLLKIKLKLESESQGKDISFIANQLLSGEEQLSGEKVQFISQNTTANDGTVTIQFRPKDNSTVGIYNMRANTKGGTIFSKFYKTVADEIQPDLTAPSAVQQKQDIVLTISGYTDAWKDANKLYEIQGESKTEITSENYSIEKDSNGTNLATLKIKTTGEWATIGEHTFRFEPKAAGGAYNPITFKANITEIESDITTNAVSSTGHAIPEGLSCTSTLPKTAKANANVEFTVTAPNGYDITSVAYQTEGAASQTITPAAGGKYSFTMPDKAAAVTVTVTPKTYTLNIDLQDGKYGDDTTISPITGTVEALMQLPENTPTKDGFNFTNWRTELNGGGNVVTNENLNTIDNMLAFFGEANTKTIYAGWAERGKFMVSYSAPEQGVTNVPNDTTAYDQESTTQIAIPEQEPERPGYRFLGWKVEGDDTLYKFGSEHDVYTNISAIEKTLEFSAQWEELISDSYKIMRVDQVNSTVNVIKRTNESAWLIVATYTDDNKLVKAMIKDITAVSTDAAGTNIDVPEAFSDNYSKVRVFMWNNLSDIEPRCDALPAEKQN